MLRRVLGVLVIAIDAFWVFKLGIGEAFSDVWSTVAIVVLAAVGLILIAGTGD
jgi:hypothetical protein